MGDPYYNYYNRYDSDRYGDYNRYGDRDNYPSRRYENDPSLSRNLTNHFYKLSTQTNMLIFGYLLLMSINHMVLGDITYSPENTYDSTKKNWFFATVVFCTLINCFILLWLKEQKRPVLRTNSRSSRIAPLIFAFFQIIILSCSLAIFFMSTQQIESKKKIMTALMFFGLNISCILSTWGFSSSVCSIARTNHRGTRTVLNE
jgi:hypothetical protein